MKNFSLVIIFAIIVGCSTSKGVYWCGDHPCINKKEREAYFKKTMIVEIRDLEDKKYKKDYEYEKNTLSQLLQYGNQNSHIKVLFEDRVLLNILSFYNDIFY